MKKKEEKIAKNPSNSLHDVVFSIINPKPIVYYYFSSLPQSLKEIHNIMRDMDM